MPEDKPIYVTRPALPPLDEFIPYLEGIWDRRWLTNCGPLHQKLEAALQEWLGVKHVVLCNNGTSALLLALRALNLKGEVITTPYSFIATGHAILWAGLKPVFVDTESDSFNIDPELIEGAITEDTAAILPVHCYGSACNTGKIDTISKRHRLPVIYDAAHAFGVECHCGSLMNHGDLSVLSFHATKVFNTFEGGAIICHDDAMRKQLEYLRNFGFEDETHIPEIGVNAKMNEVQAAMGLLQLNHIDDWIKKRKALDHKYRTRLRTTPGVEVPTMGDAQKPNYAYFPVLVTSKSTLSRDDLVAALAEHNVYTRRYFYPLISDFPLYENAKQVPDNLPRARASADSIICLPLYPDLKTEDVEYICNLIESLTNGESFTG